MYVRPWKLSARVFLGNVKCIRGHLINHRVLPAVSCPRTPSAELFTPARPLDFRRPIQRYEITAMPITQAQRREFKDLSQQANELRDADKAHTAQRGIRINGKPASDTVVKANALIDNGHAKDIVDVKLLLGVTRTQATYAYKHNPAWRAMADRMPFLNYASKQGMQHSRDRLACQYTATHTRYQALRASGLDHIAARAQTLAEWREQRRQRQIKKNGADYRAKKNGKLDTKRDRHLSPSRRKGRVKEAADLMIELRRRKKVATAAAELGYELPEVETDIRKIPVPERQNLIKAKRRNDNELDRQNAGEAREEARREAEKAHEPVEVIVTRYG